MPTSQTPEQAAAPALDDRTLRLERPRSAVMRSLLAAKDLLEAGVAAVSVHPDTPVYDPARFAWVARIEAGWRDIRAELEGLLERRDAMPSFQEILEPVGRITADDEWKTLWLVAMGRTCEGTAAVCPRTHELVRSIPGMTTAFFSILSPGKHIPAHRGAFNGLLRYHLGLVVPEPAERCRIRVGSQVLHWAEGRSLVFDDTFNHEVWNETGGLRAILFVDFARPLRQPFDALNRLLLRLGRFSPMMRRTLRNQRQWEQRFFGASTGSSPQG